MTFKEARKYSEQMLAGVEVKEVRRRAWPKNFEGIIWNAASAEDRKATDWYIVGEDVPSARSPAPQPRLLGQSRITCLTELDRETSGTLNSLPFLYQG